VGIEVPCSDHEIAVDGIDLALVGLHDLTANQRTFVGNYNSAVVSGPLLQLPEICKYRREVSGPLLLLIQILANLFGQKVA
jgi:hypothetical protein